MEEELLALGNDIVGTRLHGEDERLVAGDLEAYDISAKLLRRGGKERRRDVALRVLPGWAAMRREALHRHGVHTVSVLSAADGEVVSAVVGRRHKTRVDGLRFLNPRLEGKKIEDGPRIPRRT